MTYNYNMHFEFKWQMYSGDTVTCLYHVTRHTEKAEDITYTRDKLSVMFTLQ